MFRSCFWKKWVNSTALSGFVWSPVCEVNYKYHTVHMPSSEDRWGPVIAIDQFLNRWYLQTITCPVSTEKSRITVIMYLDFELYSVKSNASHYKIAVRRWGLSLKICLIQSRRYCRKLPRQRQLHVTWALSTITHTSYLKSCSQCIDMLNRDRIPCHAEQQLHTVQPIHATIGTSPMKQ